MSEKLPIGIATVAQLDDFDAIIDARSPAEYADDHLPGAVSYPVLSDEERARVGTLYQQVSPFEARKLGAALVARNIARHIETNFLGMPRTWRPLVYCWRGGQRSGAFQHILREIGWQAHRLQGGYKNWRHHVLAALADLPSRLRFVVVSGATGTAKSRLLEALAAEGAQVLHLEEMAAHKGSVLGTLPGEPQPSQRMFETRLFEGLRRLQAERPVFVEAESRRIGSIQLPNSLVHAMRAAPCLRIEATIEARVDFLLRDYAYWLAEPRQLIERLDHLHGLQSNDTLAAWRAMVDRKQFRDLVVELLDRHYDPLYRRSQTRNYADYRQAPTYAADDLSPAGVTALARRILAAVN